MPRKKQTGKGIPADIFNFVRDHKLISTGLGLIPHPAGQAAALIAKQMGLGKPKRKAPKRRPTQTGAGIFGDLGGGIGSIFGGLGSGVGSIAHGLFGGAKKSSVRRRAIKV